MSNIPQGLPNAPIAQGALFVIKGSGLGPANISFASTPFQTTTLSGTSVAVTVGGTTVNAPMFYTSSSQVAALLPSSTPTGAGSFTVTYNGQTSQPGPISVVAHNFGILTLNSSGQGPAIVSFTDYTLVSSFKDPSCGPPKTPCGAANPGDVLFLWGTGLGAVSGDELSNAGLGQNMPNLPLTVWLGGVQAQVGYQGRSGCCIAEDQIAITVPNNVPTGCSVPLVVQMSNLISNTTSIPIASGSRTCPDSSGTNAQQLAGRSSFNLGEMELDHFLNDSGSGFIDQAQFIFAKVSGIPTGSGPFVAGYLGSQPVGTCTVVVGSTTPNDLFFNSLTIAPIDAGSSFTITGPKGTMSVTANLGDTPVLSSTGAFLAPGNYTITGGPGKDVGTFSATITIPVSPTLTSPASSNNLTVTRAQGMPVTWNPNGSTGHVEMVLASYANPNASAQAICEVPANTGSFTIPAYILLALPPGNGTNFYFQLGDQAPAFSGSFSASGLDVGVAQSFVDAAHFGGFTLN